MSNKIPLTVEALAESLQSLQFTFCMGLIQSECTSSLLFPINKRSNKSLYFVPATQMLPLHPNNHNKLISEFRRAEFLPRNVMKTKFWALSSLMNQTTRGRATVKLRQCPKGIVLTNKYENSPYVSFQISVMYSRNAVTFNKRRRQTRYKPKL